MQRLGAFRQQNSAQVGERQPGVEDVFDEDNVLAFHRLIDIFQQFYFAAVLFLVSVAGNRDEVEAGVELDAAGKVTEENRGALQHPDQHDLLSGEVDGDLFA